MFALILVSMYIVLQAMAAMFVLTEANGAARAAARAASLGRDPYSAAQAAVSPSLRPVRVSGGGQTWRATIGVPVVVRWMPLADISRSATIPRTEP
jgi:hypothetical protein